MGISEHEGVVDGVRVRWATAPSPGGEIPPILHVHGVPTAGWDLAPFLRRAGGIAPDLPGFGRSAKPEGFDYSIAGYARFLERFTASLGLGRVAMVLHDFGGVGLALAQRQPERVARLVLINCLPLVPGYRWHWHARVWRTALLGELFMATVTRRGLELDMRAANGTPGPMPREFTDAVWEGLDRATRRAILRLYRASPERVLAEEGRRLGNVSAPALVLWSAEDPYLPAWLGQAYASALGGEVTLRLLGGTGHWAWLDRPEIVDEVAAFLAPVAGGADGWGRAGAGQRG